jgi:chaperonin GroES
MKVVPVGNNVVVQRTETPTSTAGGIVLPDAAQKDSLEGRILSIGDGSVLPGGRRVHLQVKEGDRVLFSRHAGSEIRIDGHDLLIMREADILAILS